jgi:hypothetical protein
LKARRRDPGIDKTRNNYFFQEKDGFAVATPPDNDGVKKKPKNPFGFVTFLYNVNSNHLNKQIIS